MPHSEQKVPKRLRIAESLYLLMVAFSFCLLFLSRTAEVHTVWEFLHPLFIPVFFVTTFLLLTIIFSSEKVTSKLLLVIVHSVLSHIFFVVVFPVGDVGGQQMALGRTRLVFDNVVLHGLSSWPSANFLEQIYQWSSGINFQAAISVIFARMFSVDVYWSHLLLVPMLWGIFIPVAAFLTIKALGRSENVAVLSSLLVSLFPYAVYWGAISVPISLGYIFFFYSLFFFLKHLSSNESKTTFLMVTFSVISFLSHFLAGIMSFSLLLLAMVFKKYQKEKKVSLIAARVSLLVSFIFSTSLLPLSLVYQEVVHSFQTHFSLERLYGLSTQETVAFFLFGEHINFDIKPALVFAIGPLLGLLYMVYLLRNNKRIPNKRFRVGTLFLLIGFLVVLVDYRILKLFMVNVPFREERLWVFRDFIAVPFVAIAVGSVVTFLSRKKSNTQSKIKLPFLSASLKHANVKSFAAYILIIISLSGWVTASVYYGYPHFGPLQTTSYELEAAKYIDKTTTERYIVICDLYMSYAGQIVVGLNNPRAFYFYSEDPVGTALFIEMKENPSNSTMIEATKHNNATVAYFIIEEPRLGKEEYNRIIQEAQQNGLQTYRNGTFYHRGEEKLRIYYYTKPTD